VVALAALFVRAERRAPEPFLPFTLFEDRVVAVGAAGGFLLGASMFSAAVYIPLFVQGVIGTSATTAGAVLMPFMLCWTGSSIAGGHVALRLGYRPVMTGGMGLLVAGFALLAALDARASTAAVIVPMVILGLGMGLVATMFMISMQNAVPATLRGLVTSLNVFSRNIGSAVGISLQGAVLVGVLTAGMRGLAQAGGGPLLRIADPQAAVDAGAQAQLGAAGHEAFRQLLARALHSTFVLGLILVVAALIVVLRYMPGGSVAELAPAKAAERAEAG
jgi:predicted MFS family arabinose efflux permease